MPEELSEYLQASRVSRDGCCFVDNAFEGGAAAQTWDPLAAKDAVHAAAASDTGDPFCKYPHWIRDEMLSGLLLDAGCGYGRISIPLLEGDPLLRVLGVDASTEMLGRFHEFATVRNLIDRVGLVRAGLTHIPVRSGVADVALSSAVLLHNPYEGAQRIVAEMFRCLRPGGKAIFVGAFPNRWNASGLMSALYAATQGARNGPVRSYSRSRITRLLAPYAATVTLRATGVEVLPKSFLSASLPGQHRAASAINGWASKAGAIREVAANTGIGVSIWDVVATKA